MSYLLCGKSHHVSGGSAGGGAAAAVTANALQPRHDGQRVISRPGAHHGILSKIMCGAGKRASKTRLFFLFVEWPILSRWWPGWLASRNFLEVGLELALMMSVAYWFAGCPLAEYGFIFGSVRLFFLFFFRSSVCLVPGLIVCLSISGEDYVRPPLACLRDCVSIELRSGEFTSKYFSLMK
jgi:hypothetical protein